MNEGYTQAVFAAFLLTCAWQDIRNKEIDVWLYWLFGLLAAGVMLAFGTPAEDWMDKFESMAVGAVLLLIGKMSRGAIGAGDGWFFVVTGLLLTAGENCILLVSGLVFSGCAGLGMVVWGAVSGINMRKRSLPFLPFLIPAGIWMVMI